LCASSSFSLCFDAAAAAAAADDDDDDDDDDDEGEDEESVETSEGLSNGRRERKWCFRIDGRSYKTTIVSSSVFEALQDEL
jgi:hypothetical protein